jgi:outer membrane lipoprotein-sorting protein
MNLAPVHPSPAWRRIGLALGRSARPLLLARLLPALVILQAIAQTSDPREMLDTWLEKQAQVRTWSADVVQSRKLKSLVHPLESRGRVWFAQPNRFRWQLGDPPRTIAVRTGDELLIVYPRLKQLERYPLTDAIDPAWKQALALLEVGFPSDPQRFLAQYELVSATASDSVWGFELRPSGNAARRLIERVRLEVSSEDFTLLATELEFPDGSTMRNQFSHHRLNAELDPSLFDVDASKDYEVVSPLEERR